MSVSFKRIWVGRAARQGLPEASESGDINRRIGARTTDFIGACAGSRIADGRCGGEPQEFASVGRLAVEETACIARIDVSAVSVWPNWIGFVVCGVWCVVCAMLPNGYRSLKPVWAMRTQRFECIGVSQPFFSGNGSRP